MGEVKLFVSMLVKAIAYSRCVYWFTMRLKKSSHPQVHQQVVLRQMAPGVRRLYQAWLPTADAAIAAQKTTAALTSERLKKSFEQERDKKELKTECLVGENAFMLIVKTENPMALLKQFAEHGVETATHFGRAIEWATEFGYQLGSCPKAEKLVNHLLMVPTYF